MKYEKILPLVGLFVFATACGSGNWNDYKSLIQGSGTSGKDIDTRLPEKDPLDTEMADVSGRVTGNGNLQGWIVLASPADQSGSRAAEIGPDGVFVLPRLDAVKDWTLTLLSPDWIAQAVLSMPSPQPNMIRQFFQTRRSTLPALRKDGPVIRFMDTNGITVTHHLASDLNGDGIPDGMSAFELVDTDLDGVVNPDDIDIDGDGVINVIDSDDDGDGIRDAFDMDADGDLVSDMQDQRFGTVKNDRFVVKAGASFARSDDPSAGLSLCDEGASSLRFGLQAISDRVASVVVRGAPSLLNGAAIRYPDGTLAVWDRMLADDGLNHDVQAGDLFFAREVILECGRQPRDQEIVVIDAFDRNGRLLGEYPVGFTATGVDSVTAAVDTTTRSVLFSGNPFGYEQGYSWYVNVHNPQGLLLYTSQSLDGSIRQAVLPENIVMPGETYLLSVVADTPAQVFGSPLYRSGSRGLVVVWE